MTKKEILKQMDIKDGDKIIFIRHRAFGDKTEEQRIFTGFDDFNLIGILERIQFSIMKSIEEKRV
jgi:hypothetical protein